MRRRRRSTTLRDAAGVYHVAFRLAYEGFRATVAQCPGKAGADVLAGLPGVSDTAALMVRTTACPPRFEAGDGECEWRVGKETALAEDPALFVALVDLKRREGLPGVWVVPSFVIHGHFASLEERKPYRYRPSAFCRASGIARARSTVCFEGRLRHHRTSPMAVRRLCRRTHLHPVPRRVDVGVRCRGGTTRRFRLHRTGAMQDRGSELRRVLLRSPDGWVFRASYVYTWSPLATSPGAEA